MACGRDHDAWMPYGVLSGVPMSDGSLSGQVLDQTASAGFSAWLTGLQSSKLVT